jgi:predicted oxidoreductase
MMGVGGSHAGRIPEGENTRFMHMAVGEGVTFFDDNAWDYGGGTAEEIMGKSLAMSSAIKLPWRSSLRTARSRVASVRAWAASIT